MANELSNIINLSQVAFNTIDHGWVHTPLFYLKAYIEPTSISFNKERVDVDLRFSKNFARQKLDFDSKYK